MEKDKKLTRLWHKFNCVICSRELNYFSVNEPNKRCPCIECQLKELGKDKECFS